MDRERRWPAHPALRGLQRGRGSRVDRPPGRVADRRPRLRADPPGGRRRPPALAGHRRHVSDERPVASHRGGVPALRHPVPAGRWHALLPAARGQGRPFLPADPSLRYGYGQLRADHQRSGPGDRRQDHRGVARSCRPRRNHVLGGDPGRRRSIPRPRDAPFPDPQRARRVCGAGRAAADPDWGAAAAGAPRRGPRGVGLPRDAGRRIGGRRGTLGEPARAARGHHALRRPVAGGRPRPPPGGDRSRRRPGLLRRRGRRGHAHHPPRCQGSRVPGRVHRRPRGRPLPAQSIARRREGAGGGAPTRLRRDHAGQATAVPHACLAAGVPRHGPAVHPIALPVGDPPGVDGGAAAGGGRGGTC